MSYPNPHDPLTELQSQFLHLQRFVDELNAVIIDQQRQIDVLGRRCDRLERTTRSPASKAPTDDEVES